MERQVSKPKREIESKMCVRVCVCASVYRERERDDLYVQCSIESMSESN
jgi:hypothetical protein